MPDSEIRRISHSLAKPFIERWHYSARCPTSKNIFFGWFINGMEYGLETDIFGDTLYAVIDYGIGVNPQAANYLAKITGLDVNKDNLLELTRLCRIEPRIDKFPLTRLISKCNKTLSHEGIRFIVSYSDPAHNHSGGIYRAANFQHLGQTRGETHVKEPDGTIRHRRLYYRYAERNEVSVAQARENLGLQLVKTVPKDRWFIQIG